MDDFRAPLTRSMFRPMWLGYLTVSTVAVTAFVAGWAIGDHGMIWASLALFVVAITNVVLLVKHIHWMFGALEDLARSKGQREMLQRRSDEP